MQRRFGEDHDLWGAAANAAAARFKPRAGRLVGGFFRRAPRGQVGVELLVTDPAQEVELDHLERSFRRLQARPKRDQQADDQRGIHLQRYAVPVLRDQMTRPEDAFEPAEKQLRLPTIMPPKRSTCIGPPGAATPPPTEGRQSSSFKFSFVFPSFGFGQLRQNMLI